MKFHKHHKNSSKTIFLFVTIFFAFVLALPLRSEASDLRCQFLTGDVVWGSTKNEPVEVAKIQYFLKQYEGFSNIEINGIYNTQTINAVINFQEKYKEEVLKPWGYEKGTGVVYFLTRNKINEVVCGIDIPLTALQEKEIRDFKLSNSIKTAPPTIEPVSVSTPKNNPFAMPQVDKPAVVTAPAVVATAPAIEPVSQLVSSPTPEKPQTPIEILKDESNEKIFGGWFSSFVLHSDTTKLSVFYVPKGIDFVESFILFIVSLLIINVLSTMIGKRRSVVFVVGSLVAIAFSVLLNRAYLIIPFLAVLLVSLFIFIKNTLKKDAQEYEESVFNVEPENVPDVILEEPAHEPVHMMLPVEEPDVVLEPAVDIEIKPEVLQSVPEVSTQQEVKIIMGHVVPANLPVQTPVQNNSIQNTTTDGPAKF